MTDETQAPQDARPEREELWRRLLAGQVTEVYVAGLEARVDRYVPQLLGLEPIFSRAYFYDARGVPRTSDQMGGIARQLAAESRWIAGGGPWFWDRHFAQRAQAIVIFELYDVVGHRNEDNDFGILKGRRFRRAVRAYADGRTPTEQDVWRAFLAYSTEAAAKGGLTSMESAVYEVRERYPDKTFIVADPADGRRLRAVRAADRPA